MRTRTPTDVRDSDGFRPFVADRGSGHRRASSVAAVGIRGFGWWVVTVGAVVASASVAAPAWAAQADWRWPVGGEISRAFRLGKDPYAAGAHRGIDLRARPSQVVVSACAGRVRFAGPVPRATMAVTVACGAWSVSHMPLRSARVRAGARVAAGEPLGRLASDADHSGLHLGVRRTGEEHGYVDPEPFLRGAGVPFGGPAVGGRRGPRGARPRAPRRPRAVPRVAPSPAEPSPTSKPAAAPAIAWIGLTLLVAALPLEARRRRARRVRATGQEAGVGAR